MNDENETSAGGETSEDSIRNSQTEFRNLSRQLKNVGNEDSHWGYQFIGMRYRIGEDEIG